MRDFKFVDNRSNQTTNYIAPVEPIEVLTDRDIPAGMPLTNRLDKLTTEQAVWAIRCGDAWLAYLKANGGEVVEHTGASAVEVSPAAVFMAICNTLENVWLALTNNRQQSALEPEQVAEWVDTLQWAVSVLPSGYEQQRSMIRTELDDWQSRLP